jgi:hypothetical protein
MVSRPNCGFNPSATFGQALRGGVFFITFGPANGAPSAVEYLKHVLTLSLISGQLGQVCILHEPGRPSQINTD